MAQRKITTLAVDNQFFKNIFEKERKKMQDKIGLGNLSQANFSKMIKGFKIKQPRQDLSQVNTRFKGRRNVKI
ncbi:hypothetical protein LCGC14_1508680 [marine sediment metagenome]|uniref:Uncharacterized protein n=1 Tax=marine sediment metagenome TaxID=412755 RepID=A0A0F9J288_9ZZZZ